MRKWLLGGLVSLSLALSCVAPPSPGKVASSPESIPPPPKLDLYALAPRLGRGPVSKVVNPQPPSYEVGRRDTFWLLDLGDIRTFAVEATLCQVTPRLYLYLEDGGSLKCQDLEGAGQEFEGVYALMGRYFGQEWTPGVDNDPHLTILFARIPFLAGYFSSFNEYPRTLFPYSNEREMVSLNGEYLRGRAEQSTILTHELQHLIHWSADPTEEAWVQEGLAEVAAEVVGGGSTFDVSFIISPDTQLTAWTAPPGPAAPHYGAAHLFMKYLLSRCGGYQAAKDLVAEPRHGIEGIDYFLREQGCAASFEDIFQDWVVANYLDEPGGGIYKYPDIQADVATKPATGEPRPRISVYPSAQGSVAAEPVTEFGERSGVVHQYAADYFDLGMKGDVVIYFSGANTVKLVPNEAYSGSGQWWSNRADNMDSTLTREFDLSGVTRATLSYWLWYDTDRYWDYGYIEASRDGVNWSILKGEQTTALDPFGVSFGPGYTGSSGGEEGSRWIKETVDLSAYAGSKVFVRFEFLTDDAVNGPGLCLDDIAIPQIGFFDDAEGDGGWVANGFIRTDNRVRQRFMVQVVEVSTGVTVRQMPLDGTQGQLVVRGLGSQVDHAVLIIAALAPATTEVAGYQFTVRPSP